MSRKEISPGVRKHARTERMKTLAASTLARKVGYLRIEDLPGLAIFDTLPIISFNAKRAIRPKNELLLIKHGMVEIRHASYDRLVSTLEAGALFGNLPLVGQSMLRTKAFAGTPGATVAVMDEAAALQWVGSNPAEMMRLVGVRLTRIESEHYCSIFQLADSRIAKLLLELAGHGAEAAGLSHEEIGEKIGIYRETVTNILDALKSQGLIKIGRKHVTILDKRALGELSEL